MVDKAIGDDIEALIARVKQAVAAPPEAATSLDLEDLQETLMAFADIENLIGDLVDRHEADDADGLPADLAGLEELVASAGDAILADVQRFVMARHNHPEGRLKFTYDPAKSTWQSVHDLLALARETGKEGPVAQHLVGAKLQLRFPDLAIGNESCSTADDQLGRPGDFQVGDTAIHVTVAPMLPVYEKCKRNVEAGLRPYLLVPDRALVGARQNAEGTASGRIAVESIESFVGQNIEELSTFTTDRLAHGFRRLLETYNARVDAVELDKSLLIEIPYNLRGPASA